MRLTVFEIAFMLDGMQLFYILQYGIPVLTTNLKTLPNKMKSKMATSRENYENKTKIC